VRSLAYRGREIQIGERGILKPCDRLSMTGIAQDIERYNLAYRLAWKHVSELQKRGDPHIALRLHYSIRRQLKAGETEPVFIAAEALKAIENLNGQIDKNESLPTRVAGWNSRIRRALSSATGQTATGAKPNSQS
jgi:hypothetical protein